MTCLVCARTREKARSRENQLPSSPPLPLPRCGGNATHGEYPENINRHTTILQLSAHAYRVIGHWTGLSCRAHDAAGEDVSVSRDGRGQQARYPVVIILVYDCHDAKLEMRAPEDARPGRG
jgi:hypothetical protein